MEPAVSISEINASVSACLVQLLASSDLFLVIHSLIDYLYHVLDGCPGAYPCA